MGTEATESYLHLLNQRTPAHRDQDYLNYILVNHATVPDRTDYIMDHTQPSPLPPLATDIKQQSLLNPAFFCATLQYGALFLSGFAGINDGSDSAHAPISSCKH